jgi:hypothetical protein
LIAALSIAKSNGRATLEPDEPHPMLTSFVWAIRLAASSYERLLIIALHKGLSCAQEDAQAATVALKAANLIKFWMLKIKLPMLLALLDDRGQNCACVAPVR